MNIYNKIIQSLLDTDRQSLILAFLLSTDRVSIASWYGLAPYERDFLELRHRGVGRKDFTSAVLDKMCPTWHEDWTRASLYIQSIKPSR